MALLSKKSNAFLSVHYSHSSRGRLGLILNTANGAGRVYMSVRHQLESGRQVTLSSREQVHGKEGSRANKSLGRSF